MKKKNKNLFNPAFEDLQAKMERSPQEKDPFLNVQSRENELDDEMNYFFHAMSGVTPIRDPKRRVAHGPGSCAQCSFPPTDESKQVMEQLRGLVAGSVELDITFSDEYIEGAVRGFSRKLMKKLKRGELPVQDHIDLHGLTKQDAEKEVARFLAQSLRNGLRCVLIVHGRGLNSPENVPVLKQGLPQWLSRGRVRKMVLAFATARSYDGGTGATYVFLRQR